MKPAPFGFAKARSVAHGRGSGSQFGRLFREHQILIVVAAIGVAALVFDTWAAWHQFAQQQQQFHQSASFWSLDFFAFWGNGVAQNWQSEALFGIGLVLILRSTRLREVEDQDQGGKSAGAGP